MDAFAGIYDICCNGGFELDGDDECWGLDWHILQACRSGTIDGRVQVWNQRLKLLLAGYEERYERINVITSKWKRRIPNNNYHNCHMAMVCVLSRGNGLLNLQLYLTPLCLPLSPFHSLLLALRLCWYLSNDRRLIFPTCILHFRV